mgnify:CR=1 FL=1
MNILGKLKSLNLDNDAVINFTLSEGTDVFVHNETEIETALADTNVVESFSELVSQKKLLAMPAWGNTPIMEEMRESGLLEEYERDFTFPEYLTSIINENFYELEYIDSTIEKFDHKRGFCTLTADVNVTYGNLIEANPYISSEWTVSVKTQAGTLTLS